MENSVPRHDIIVIGTSAGGVEALIHLVAGLSPKLKAAVFVVLHMPAESVSALPRILSRWGPLPATAATDHLRIEQGCIYVAPPDHHLLLEPGQMRVVQGPKENRHRPAVDPLFRSAALTYGPRVIGVILTGSLNDGTSGLWAVKQQGGIAVVQDPEEALFPDMPQSAIASVQVDYIVPLSQMATLLSRLVDQRAAADPPGDVPQDRKIEMSTAAMEQNDINEQSALGAPSLYTCPECGSTLWEIHEGTIVRFRCRANHAYTLEVLVAQRDETLEETLWRSHNTLEEQASLLERLIERTRHYSHEQEVVGLEEKLRRIRQYLMHLEQMLL